MENNHFAYTLRGQIEGIFAECTLSKEKGGLQNGDSPVGVPTPGDAPHEQVNFSRGKNKVERRGSNRYEDTGWSGRRGESNLKREEESIFGNDGKTLMVQSYTSLLYEGCEDKLHVLLANRTMKEGRVEMQINGEGESFNLPCRLAGNVLSSFSPPLEKGVYKLFFFINKERMHAKLVSCGVDMLCRGVPSRDMPSRGILSKDMPWLPLHVIEMSRFDQVGHSRGMNNLPPYSIRANNHVHTSRGLLKMYGLMHKQCRQMANREGTRDGRVTLGMDYQLHTNSDRHFYGFLSAYKEAYTKQHPQVNGKRGENKNLHINSINFVSSLNFENHLEHCRIPTMYKRLLYDHCAYGDKAVIMSHHTRLLQGDYSSGGLSAHVFVKDQLGGPYSVFAFDLAMGGVENRAGREAHKAVQGATSRGIPPPWTKNPPVSSLLRFSCDQDSCADMRQWSYVEAIPCRKNDVAREFYLTGRRARGANVESSAECTAHRPMNRPVNLPVERDCPVPVELINHRNAFKTYAPGIRLSERVSLFFEAWDCAALPVEPFSQLSDCNVHCESVCAQMRGLSALVRSARFDALSFEDLCEGGQKWGVIKSGGTEKMNGGDEKADGQGGHEEDDALRAKGEDDALQANGEDDALRTNGEDDQHDADGAKRRSGPRRAGPQVRPHDEHPKCATKQTRAGAASNCPLSSFVSFVITIDGKIYHSVLPISRLLLLFVVNYWMHFAD
ncbi:hypothetical protein PVBG_04583 [Plasmodium vivax Brazil I]|uniref:Uncharacterized protein n=1 Tax=Plasmodium vivax (strain Brazil I) TaxID=1033975 RepID=A0A0J9SZU9_PLAV1|nr:hypothetical protein PVBG_04583 [Plasmodium vivax Brazil I]